MVNVDAIALARAIYGVTNIVAAFEYRCKSCRSHGFCSDLSVALETNCLTTSWTLTKFCFEISFAWTWLHSRTCYITSNATTARTKSVCSSLFQQNMFWTIHPEWTCSFTENFTSVMQAACRLHAGRRRRDACRNAEPLINGSGRMQPACSLQCRPEEGWWECVNEIYEEFRPAPRGHLS